MKVVVYSHDADVRAQVRLAIGRRPAMDVPDAEIIDVATQPALFRLLDARGADVMVLDGEAQPAGGMGVCRQAKDEIYNCPPAGCASPSSTITSIAGRRPMASLTWARTSASWLYTTTFMTLHGTDPTTNTGGRVAIPYRLS